MAVAAEHTTKDAGRGVRTLEARFDPRSNSLTMMRLGMATLVAISHAGAIAAGQQLGFGPNPKAGMAELGDFAVDAFFVLSGFLVTISYLRLNSLPRYLWHRFVRIMPAFWACLILTAMIIAPLIAGLEGRAPSSVFPDSLGYITSNAALRMSDFSVAGLPTGTHQPGNINGALWTLFYEFACYLALAALGVTGALTRHRHLTLAALGAAWVTYAADVAGLIDLPMPLLRRFLLLFLAGACARLYWNRLPITGPLAALAAVVTVVSVLALPDYRALGAIPFAYVLLWATVALPFRWDPGIDLSYGMYIFHWPVESILVTAGAAALGLPVFTVLSVAIAAGIAFVSWRVIERPALSLKSMPPPWRSPRK